MIHTRYSRLVSGTLNVAVTNVFTGDGEFAFDGDVVAAAEAQLDAAITPAQIRSVMISGGGQPLTVCTNAPKAGTPTDTILVPSGGVFLWALADLTANPFTAPVTALYVTNEGASNTTVKIRILLDVTA